VAFWNMGKEPGVAMSKRATCVLGSSLIEVAASARGELRERNSRRVLTRKELAGRVQLSVDLDSHRHFPLLELLLTRCRGAGGTM
jgi:hypothetical protein